MRKNRKIIRMTLLIAAIVIVIAAGLYFGNKYKKNNPVWNDVTIHQSDTIRVGQKWETFLQILDDAGLGQGDNLINIVPEREGKWTGCNIDPSFDGERVRSVYYEINDNEADCEVCLAGIVITQETTYEDIAAVIGEAIRKTDTVRERVAYFWESGDKEMIIDFNQDGTLLDFFVEYR